MEIAFEMKNIVSFLWLLPYISRRLKYKMHKYLGFPCLVQNVITLKYPTKRESYAGACEIPICLEGHLCPNTRCVFKKAQGI